MTDIDGIGRAFLAVAASCTLLTAACMEIEQKGGDAWSLVAIAVIAAIPWVIGGLLAICAAVGSVPW